MSPEERGDDQTYYIPDSSDSVAICDVRSGCRNDGIKVDKFFPMRKETANLSASAESHSLDVKIIFDGALGTSCSFTLLGRPVVLCATPHQYSDWFLKQLE
jgi:hypothetical protein